MWFAEDTLFWLSWRMPSQHGCGILRGISAPYLEVSACLHVSTWLDSSALRLEANCQSSSESSAFFLSINLTALWMSTDVACIQVLPIRVWMQMSSINRLIITNASGGSDTISVPLYSPSPPSVFLTHFEALGILIMHTPTTSLSNISMLMPVSYAALIKDCYCDTV